MPTPFRGSFQPGSVLSGAEPDGSGEAWPDRVGLVHDWLPVYAGAERVLEQMIETFPGSDVYSLIDFISEDQRGFLQGKSVETSFIQNLPFSEQAYRYYLPLAPLAIEQFDLRDHDVVVSSSYAVAKGALTRSDQLHISYVHSPIRYAWDLYHDYLSEGGIGRRLRNLIARPILHYMRLYDVCTAPRADMFIANSRHVARRIWKRYRRPAHVVYPPVDVDRFSLETDKEAYYLTMSRLVSYKRIDLVVRAFSEMPDKELVVIGDGPQRSRIEDLAGPNVRVLGYQPDAAVTHYMQRARAFVFAAEEDFGIVPVEAQACGTPVLAYGRGGSRETILPGTTGLFFGEQSPAAIRECVRDFENDPSRFRPARIRRHAERFDIDSFRSAFGRLVQDAYSEFIGGATGDGAPPQPAGSSRTATVGPTEP
jgi:glycosyltransferase involved in cell wall biosynthesis